ncbi:hypothetical protein DEO72_LG7g1367 [Vigna unguiculata]|uniref:Uncharacterized protein n=1 Tax=Vigna unguiculata TaxID=3917 RepID=A0A4D6MH77_VIGUN|nr:hypothetical protein DEO72_LG7g1367 [Vigna unguiculata]
MPQPPPPTSAVTAIVTVAAACRNVVTRNSDNACASIAGKHIPPLLQSEFVTASSSLHVRSHYHVVIALAKTTTYCHEHKAAAPSSSSRPHLLQLSRLHQPPSASIAPPSQLPTRTSLHTLLLQICADTDPPRTNLSVHIYHEPGSHRESYISFETENCDTTQRLHACTCA